MKTVYVVMTLALLILGVGCTNLAENKSNALAIKIDDRITDFKIQEVKDIQDNEKGIAHVLYGSFKIKSNLEKGQKLIRVPFIIPFDKNWIPCKSAKNIIFHCPYVCEYKFFQTKRPRHRWFGETAGFSFYSLHLEHRKYYKTMRAKGFTELVLSIQKLLNKWYHIETKNLLLTGESAGPYMARLMIQHSPNKIDAFACLGGVLYDIEKPGTDLKGSRVACLSLDTVSPYREKPRTGSETSIQVLRALTPPKWALKDHAYFHHAPGKDAWDLMHLFVKGVAELRENNGGIVPPYKEWTVKEESKVINASGSVKKLLYFPSKEFKNKWDSMPIYDIFKLACYPELLYNGYTIEPKNKTPKQIVLFINDPKFERSNHLNSKDALYYLSIKGVVAGSIFVNMTAPDETKKRLKIYLTQLMNSKKWGNIPITVLGVGIGGEIAKSVTASLEKDTNAPHQIKTTIAVKGLDWFKNIDKELELK